MFVQRRGGVGLRALPAGVAGARLPRQPAVLRRPRQAAGDHWLAAPHTDRAQIRSGL